MASHSLQKTVKVLKRGNYKYTIVMELSYTDPKPSNVSRPSNKQKELLQKIIRQLRTQSLFKLCSRGTICTVEDGRLDSQTSVGDQARANLQFQIGSNTYGVVVLNTFPTEAPTELQGCRINDREYGFTMGQIMAFIQSGFYHSSNTQTYTYINWRISKVFDMDEKDFLRYLAIFTGLTVKCVTKKMFIKTGAKIAGKTAAKMGGKTTAKMGGKMVAKAIPFVGLGCGVVFGTWRALHGDFGGAVAEVGSGFVSLVPGVGTAASIAIDIGIAYYDVTQIPLNLVTSFDWQSENLHSEL